MSIGIAPSYTGSDGIHREAVGTFSSNGYSSTAVFTATAGAYSAGDNMDVAKEFVTAGPAGGGDVIITGTRLLIEDTAVISGETSYTLHLFSAEPPIGLIDGAAWDLPAGDRSVYLGSVSLGTVVDIGSTVYVETNGLSKQVSVPVGGSLWGQLVTVGGFTATATDRNVTITTRAA